MQVPPLKKSFRETMPYVDYLFGNEDEAEAFAESEGWKTKNITEIAGKVRHSVTTGRALLVYTTSCWALHHEGEVCDSESCFCRSQVYQKRMELEGEQ